MVVFVSWLPVLDDSNFYTTVSTQQALEVSGGGSSGKKIRIFKGATWLFCGIVFRLLK